MMNNYKYSLIVIIFIFFSCVEQEKECYTPEKVLIKNKAKNNFGGFDNIVIDNERIIKKILSLSEKDIPLYEKNLVNNNLGYIELLKSCDEKESYFYYFSIIITKHNGIIIRKKGANYFVNDDLSLYIFKEININLKKSYFKAKTKF